MAFVCLSSASLKYMWFYKQVTLIKCDLNWRRFVYRNTLYALLQNAFVHRVRMLYTDIYLFYLHSFFDDLVKEIKSCFQVRDVFDFSEIRNEYCSNFARNNALLYAGIISYFSNVTKREIR